MAKTLTPNATVKRKPSASSASTTKKRASSGKVKVPVRLPQRSEVVSGDESKAPTPIAAAQKSVFQAPPKPHGGFPGKGGKGPKSHAAKGRIFRHQGR